MNTIDSKIIADVNEFLKDANISSIKFYMDISYKIVKCLEGIQDMKFSKQQVKMSLEDKISNLQTFYKKMGIEIDLDKLINDGTIDFQTTEYYEPKLMGGLNYYDNKHKAISVVNTGYLWDNLVFAHEISHYLNQPLNYRSDTSNMLTETLAYLDQFIYADYLQNLGYADINKFYKMFLISSFKIAKYTHQLLSVMWAFYNTGSLAKEDYEWFYQTLKEDIIGDYESNIKIFINSYKNGFKVNQKIWDILAILLVPYMLKKYKEDEDYTKISELHQDINKMTMEEVFKKIGINDLENDNDFLIENLVDFKESILNSGYNRK